MRKVKAGCTAAALLAAMFAMPAMAQSTAGGGVGASGPGGMGGTGGVSAGTGGGVSAGTGGSVGSGAAAAAASTPNANDPSAAPGLRSAARVDDTMNTTMPRATVPGGAVVQFTPRTDVMGASGAALVQTGPTTVTYSHYFVNVPADAMSRPEFRRWMSLK